MREISDSNVSKKGVFHWIAPVYGLFYRYQKKSYRAIFRAMEENVDLSSFQTVLDVGCGTGALSSVLSELGYDVTCVEPVARMIQIGQKKKQNRCVNFIQADALKGLPLEDKSFDFAFVAYVAHGMQKEERLLLYEELSRVTRHVVIFHEYNQNRSILTNVVEWMEGGDYFGFIRSVQKELSDAFHEVRVVDVGPRAAWYICCP